MRVMSEPDIIIKHFINEYAKRPYTITNIPKDYNVIYGTSVNEEIYILQDKNKGKISIHHFLRFAYRYDNDLLITLYTIVMDNGEVKYYLIFSITKNNNSVISKIIEIDKPTLYLIKIFDELHVYFTRDGSFISNSHFIKTLYESKLLYKLYNVVELGEINDSEHIEN